MIAGHTRALRAADPLPSAIKISRRVDPAADYPRPDQLLYQVMLALIG
jgi:hypothetical protein